MRFTRSLFFVIISCELLAAPMALGQSSIVSETRLNASASAEANQAQQPKLSRGAEEIANTIGVASLIDRFYNLSERDRGIGGAMSLEALSLRQEITENIIGASLEVDGLIAEIDSELTHIFAVRAQLEAKRDRALAISSLATIIAGGVSGVLGSALQLSESTSKLGSAVVLQVAAFRLSCR